MKSVCRYLSFVAAATVITRGTYLVWQQSLGDRLNGHYEPLATFMDYLVYFGFVAAVGVGLGIAGKTKVGIFGNLAHIVFVTILYLNE